MPQTPPGGKEPAVATEFQTYPAAFGRASSDRHARIEISRAVFGTRQAYLYLRIVRILLAGLIFLAAPPGWAAVSVQFIEPENYTDLSLSGSSTGRIQQYILNELSKFLVSLGDRALPSGQGLRIEVHDIDMAGSYEPWRAPLLNNTRIVRDVYWPRMEIHSILRDARGSVLKEQREQLSDLNYLILANPYGYSYNDPLRYEKAMLRRWFDTNFGIGQSSADTR